MKFQAIIFDLFGTLVPSLSQAESDRRLEEMAIALSLPASDFKRLWREGVELRDTGAYPTMEAYVEHIRRSLGGALDDDLMRLANDINMRYYRRIVEPRHDAVDALTRLKKAGFEVGLISDCSPATVATWPESGFELLIDQPIFSCEVGIKKPDARIYQLACERLGVSPKECLYVGDGGSNELSGALAVGMTPVLLRVPEETYEIYRPGGEDWDGTRIARLIEVLQLVTRPDA